MKAIITDTETTGVNDPEPIEVAWIEVTSPGDGPLKITGRYHQRFKPSKPIELGALATHHILDEWLVDEPPASEFRLPNDIDYIIGHNIDYDWGAMGSPDVKRIDTLALSRLVWPELDSHTQGALLYHIDRRNATERLKNAHSAAMDIIFCLDIMNAILEQKPATDWEDLWSQSEDARIPRVMPFGKHKGLPIEQVPPQYVRWVLNEPDMDPYVKKAFLR